MYKIILKPNKPSGLIKNSIINLAYSLSDKVTFFIIIYMSSFSNDSSIYSHLVIYWGGIQLMGAVGGAPINLLSINGNISTYKDLNKLDYFFLISFFLLSCFFLFFDLKIVYILIAIIGALSVTIKSLLYGKIFREKPIYLIYITFFKLIFFLMALVLIDVHISFDVYLYLLLGFISLDLFLCLFFSSRINISSKIKPMKKSKNSFLLSLLSSLSVQSGQIFSLKIIHIYYPFFSNLASIIYQSRNILLALPSAFSSSIIRSISMKEMEYNKKYNLNIYIIGFFISILSVIISYLMTYFNGTMFIEHRFEFVLFSGVSGLVFIFSLFNSILFSLEKYLKSAFLSLSFGLISIVSLFINENLVYNFMALYFLLILLILKIKF